MKVVLDTNVLLSGLMYPDSQPGRIVSAWRHAQFEVATSLAQLEKSFAKKL
ncbi:MAG TPA: PIN domain-containing protein [Vicinamibacteria bacterium]|nr:PIN domain-containing protein [Vicinamibacteria bacterium]